MSNLPAQTTPVYATDEDVAAFIGGDFVTLCPPWQQCAQGIDGVFAAGTPWTLTSASVNFQANGVSPNQVVQLTAPKAQYPGSGALFAVDTILGNTITLRRLHQDLNVGQPPAPAGGLSAVAFAINTLFPQLEEASFSLKRRFGIDENVTYRSSQWVYDLRDLRMATVFHVLLDRYAFESRGDKGDFAIKIERVRARLDDVLSRVQVRWGAQGNSAPPSTVFSCKITR